MIRQTHTYALLPVSEATFNEIRDKLLAAGYDDYIMRAEADEPERVTMQGLALVLDVTSKPTEKSET